MRKYILYTLFFALLPTLLNAQLRINEVMQSNISLIDDYNDFPSSWIELFNPTEDSISLYHHVIESDNGIYTFGTDTTIPPHSYILLYGDEQYYKLHISFKVDFEKESTIRLFSPKGILSDSILIPAMQQKGVSYGRDDNGEVGWMTKDTPEKHNSSISPSFLFSPELSSPSGFYTQPFIVHLKNKNNYKSTTYYTTNGSIPTINDSIFADSLVITGTKIIRLKTFSEGSIPSDITSYSYLFPDHEITLPVISIISDSLYLFDEKKGIYVEGTYNQYKENYKYDWHRFIHINYFNEKGEVLLDQPGEMRIAGATSRKLPQKSLAIYSKKRLSGDDFPISFWEEKPNIKKVHSFLLRNSGNDFLLAHLRDAAAQSYAGHTIENIEYQAYQPVITYINGEYYGLMNLRERTNIDYINSNHPETKERIDVIENWTTVNSGSATAAIHLYETMYKEDVTFEELAELIDIDEFINYFIIETYFGNSDYPDNNIVMWKEHKEGSKWRWILKDLDMSSDFRTYKDGKIITYTSNYFEQFLTLSPESEDFDSWDFPTKLMRVLVSMKPFQDLLIERFSVYMGDFLNPRHIIPHIDSLAQKIEYEIPFTDERYNDYTTNDYTDWYQEIDLIKNYPSKRNWLNSNSMKNFFHLGDIYHLTINNPYEKDLPFTLTVNNTEMLHTSFDGYYYKGRPIVIHSKGKGGASDIKGWKIEKQIRDIVLTEYAEGDSVSLMIPSNSLIEHVTISTCDSTYKIQSKNGNGICIYKIDGGLLCTNLTQESQILISDLSGKIIFNQKGFKREEETIDLPKGCFILNDGTKREKIIVTK